MSLDSSPLDHRVSVHKGKSVLLQETTIRNYAQYFYTHDDRCLSKILRLRDIVYDTEGRLNHDVGNAMLLKRAEFAYDMLVSSMDCAISTTPMIGVSSQRK